jgi:hypothetical protein
MLMLLRLLRTSGAVGVAAIATLVMAVTPADAVTGPGEGSAYGASATVSVLSGVLGPTGLTVHTGRLAATNTGGPTSASAVDATFKGLVSAKVITSLASYDKTSGNVTASAKLVHVALPVLAALAGHTPTASVISSQCHATSSGITGGSDLADLDLGRIGHVSVATPNLKVGIPGVLAVIANEQIHNADGSLTVNALDITLLGGSLTGAVGSGHIVLASSTCAPATSQPGGSGPTTTQTIPPTATSVPTSEPGAPSAPAPGSGEVSIVPAGAPETGDGTLATVIVH